MCNPMQALNGALYLDRMCQCGLRAEPWSHIGILMPASLQNLAVPQDLYSSAVSLWNDCADPVFDDVGLAGLKSKANAFLLA